MAKKEEISLEEMIQGLAEQVKQQATRPNYHGYVPHDKQVRFHSSQKKHRLYIGGNRSGKTTGGIIEDLHWCRGKHPYRKVPEGGVLGRIVAVDLKQGLEKIIIPELKRWCPLTDLKYPSWEDSYDKELRTLYFKNGSELELMSYEQEVAKFAGTSRHFIHFDEEPPQDIYLECLARLVDTGGSWWMTLTPILGMEWMYDDIYMKGTTDPDSEIDVIEVDMSENPHLNPAEIESFLSALPEDDREARKQGKFVRRGGLIYKDFQYSTHVIDPITHDELVHKEIYVSGDHGYNNPTAWLWHAVDNDGNVITFAEHYQAEMIVSEHAKRIKEINGSYGISPGIYIGDPAMAQRNGSTGSSIQSDYALEGIYVMPANNEVLSGINKINSYLAYDLKRNISPRWFITRNCVNLIREIQRYRWKTWANKKSERQNNKHDIPHKKDDHACDSARYFFTLMPDLTPIKPAEPEKPVHNMGQAAVNIEIPRYDEMLKRDLQPTPYTDWVIDAADEYMGGEW